MEKPESQKFGVFCITISDRAAKGLYEQGDLSGKAMQECIEEHVNVFESIGSQIVSDDKEVI